MLPERPETKSTDGRKTQGTKQIIRLKLKPRCVAALLAGQGVCEIAREYKIAHPVVSSWKAKLGTERLTELEARRAEHLDNLIYDFLTTTLVALQRQAEAMSDEAYIKAQPANEVGILFGIFSDKVVRLLEAHAAARDYVGNIPALRVAS